MDVQRFLLLFFTVWQISSSGGELLPKEEEIALMSKMVEQLSIRVGIEPEFQRMTWAIGSHETPNRQRNEPNLC